MGIKRYIIIKTPVGTDPHNGLHLFHAVELNSQEKAIQHGKYLASEPHLGKEIIIAQSEMIIQVEPGDLFVRKFNEKGELILV